MATVRQLTTRFSFETDRSGIRKFNQSLAGMKKSVAGLAVAFGATKIVKSLVRLGTGMESSVVRAQRFSQEVKFLRNNTVRLTGEMSRSWQNVREAIPGRVVLSDFLNGFADFKLFLKGGTMQQFNKLFITAGRIAKISGEPAVDVFKRLQEAAASGDISDLQKVFKGIDVKDVKMKQFVDQMRAVDPRGIATVTDRVNRFFEIIKANEKELDAFSRRVVFGTFGGKVGEFKANVRAMGEAIGAGLTRPLGRAFDAANKFFMEWEKNGPNFKGFLETVRERSELLALVFELMWKLGEKFIDTTVEMGKAAEAFFKVIKNPFPDKPKAKADPRGPEIRLLDVTPRNDPASRLNRRLLEGGGISINAPITITGVSDSKAVADEVIRALKTRIETAKSNFRRKESARGGR